MILTRTDIVQISLHLDGSPEANLSAKSTPAVVIFQYDTAKQICTVTQVAVWGVPVNRLLSSEQIAKIESWMLDKVGRKG